MKKEVRKLNKKKIITLASIVFLLIVGICIFFFAKGNSYDKSNPMNREEVINLVAKANMNNINFYYSIREENDDNTQEFYIKDNIMLSKMNSKITNWDSYGTQEFITFWEIGEEKPIAVVQHTYPEDEQYGWDYSILRQEDLKYQYLGKTQEKGRTTIVIELTGINHIQFCIDEETGVIVKRIDYFEGGKKNEVDRNVKFNIVTDKDIIMPDLENYTVQEN